MSKKAQQYALQLTALLQTPVFYVTHRTKNRTIEKGFNIKGYEFYISPYDYSNAWKDLPCVLVALNDLLIGDCRHATRFSVYDEMEIDKQYGKQYYTKSEWQQILIDKRKNTQFYAEKAQELTKWINVILAMNDMLADIPA